MSNSFESLFQPHIFERGYDYYATGRVQEMKKNGTHYFATVRGSDTYYVRIETTEEGFIAGMACDCPYADGGLNCKHMAAVLLALTEHENSGSVIQAVNPLDELPEVLQRIGKEEALDFLQEQLHQNDDLLRTFQNKYVSYFGHVSANQYVSRIHQTFRDYTRYEGYVSYRQVNDFFHDVMSHCREMNELLEAKEYRIPLKMGIAVLEELKDLQIDDSDGTPSVIAGACCEVFNCIAEECKDSHVIDQLFKWLCNCMQQQDLDDLEDEVREVFAGYFNEKKYASSKMEVVESRVQSALAALNQKGGIYREHELTTWILMKADTMKAIGATDEEINKLLSKYIYLDEIRERFVDSLERKGDYLRAARLLNEGKQISSEKRRRRPGTVRKYCDRLISVYKKMGDHEAYKRELYEMLYEHDMGSVSVYTELRDLYTPEEWVQQREEIIRNLSHRGISNFRLDRIYAEEKLLDRLLASVLSSESICSLEEYEDMLKCEYSRELLGAYEKAAKKEAESANKRSKYRKIASILNHMRSYSGGGELVRQIVKEFRVKYKRRKAMQEELDQVEIGSQEVGP